MIEGGRPVEGGPRDSAGTPLSALHPDNCPNCGAALPSPSSPGASVICSYCGTKFSPNVPPPPPPPPTSSTPTLVIAPLVGQQKMTRGGKIALACFIVGIILVTTLLPLYMTGVLSSPLSVQASVSPGSGPHPLLVSYQASASGGQGPYTYSWDFGDGGTSSSASGSYSYTAEGVYTATVSVYDNNGNLAGQAITVTVLGTLSSAPISQVVNVSLFSGVSNAQDYLFQVPSIGSVNSGGMAQNASVAAVFQVLGCIGAPPANCNQVQVALMTSLQYSQFSSGATVSPFWCSATAGGGACSPAHSGSASVNVSAQGGQTLNLVIWDTYAGSVTVYLSENFQLYQIS